MINLEKIDIESIKKYNDNAKLHNDRQIKKIKKSILQYGYNDPIAIDENNIIIEGEGRYLALKELIKEGNDKYKTIDVIRLSHLTDEQKRAYSIAHNKITLDTEFNYEKLKEEFDKLINTNFDLELTGFDPDEIENIISFADFNIDDNNSVNIGFKDNENIENLDNSIKEGIDKDKGFEQNFSVITKTDDELKKEKNNDKNYIKVKSIPFQVGKMFIFFKANEIGDELDEKLYDIFYENKGKISIYEIAENIELKKKIARFLIEVFNSD